MLKKPEFIVWRSDQRMDIKPLIKAHFFVGMRLMWVFLPERLNNWFFPISHLKFPQTTISHPCTINWRIFTKEIQFTQIWLTIARSIQPYLFIYPNYLWFTCWNLFKSLIHFYIHFCLHFFVKSHKNTAEKVQFMLLSKKLAYDKTTM